MTLVKKNFRCFRCNYLNKVTVPHYFKGKKCECCQSFNYFNYIPNYHKRNSNRNAFNIYENKDNFSISRNNFEEETFNFRNNFFYNEPNFNSFSNRNETTIYINNNRNNDTDYTFNHINEDQNINRRINNNNNIMNFDTFTHIYNNNVFNSINTRKDEEKIISWLPKQICTESIKNKYKDENCTICLEEIKGNIAITKCNHIFHYKCISSYINNTNKSECPNCRSDLRTGLKKIVVNRNINNYNQGLRINQRINSINENVRNNSYSIDTESDFCSYFCMFLVILIILKGLF